MKKTVMVPVFIALCLLAAGSFAQKAVSADSGEALFMANCKICHPDGGNIVNPKKTLHKADREANNIKTAADIVNRMRNPGPGMTKFDEKTIPDKDAHAIASYVLKTFNK